MVTRRVTYRLYPSRHQEAQLHQWRRMHCALYNAALADRKTSYQKLGVSVGYFDQQNRLPEFKQVWPEYVELGSHALQATLKRVDFAYSRFFKGLGGYPKFKASRRWRKYQSVKSKLQRQVTRQRENWLHQITSDIVSGNSLIAGEQLNVQGMTRKAKKGSKRKAQKAGLNRSILSVGFGMIGGMLGYKSAEAGGFYVESPTRQLKPSQRCVKCWELTPKTLRDRVHVCSNPQCGHVEDRDVNAAQVNLIWARGQVSEAHVLASLVVESASSTACGSMRQLAAKKRQKPCAS